MSTGETAEHRALVRALMNYLNQQGFQTIGAACEGFRLCEPMDGRVPDFLGRNTQGAYCIGEAKTCDDLVNDRDRTNDQFRAFAARQATFYILVPRACVDQLNQILREIGLLGRQNIITLQI